MSAPSSKKNHCPSCGKPLPPKPSEQLFGVFCSKRCQTIDLGNWLSDYYRIPLTPSDEDAEDLALAMEEQRVKSEVEDDDC
jgi:endogenous inhibitor of DNA gyrase (YacG/DUF329 family)